MMEMDESERGQLIAEDRYRQNRSRQQWLAFASWAENGDPYDEDDDDDEDDE